MVLSKLRPHNFDDKRIEELKVTESGLQRLIVDELISLLQLFSFDSGRNEALRILEPKLTVITVTEATALLKLFSFDSGRIKALHILEPKLRATDYETMGLIELCAFEPGRKEMRDMLNSRPTT
jgi:hypothetical protein